MRKVLFLLLILLNLQVAAYHLGCTIPSVCLYAQNYGNEGFYECEDDDGSIYYSSLPCGQEACVTVCPLCHTSYPCNGTHYCTYVPPGSSGEDITWNTGGYDDNDNNEEDSGSESGDTGDNDIPCGESTGNGRYISIRDLRFKQGVTLARPYLLPDTLHRQTLAFECVVRAIAFLSELDGHDYNYAYEKMLSIADSIRRNLSKKGILPNEIHRIFDEYCTIAVEPYNEKLIEQYIDSGTPVAAVTREEQPHMVVIFGYDNGCYYTAAGGKDAYIYWKAELGGTNKIYLFNNINPPYKCKQNPYYYQCSLP